MIGMMGRFVHAAVAVLAVCAIAATEASAVSARVKFACATDYLANCRAFRPDTPEVRVCMRKVGSRLSTRCVNALVADGEVSKAEVDRRRRAASLRH